MATVIATTQARELVGSKLVVGEAGAVAGHVGRGNLEEAVEADCRKMLTEGVARTLQYPDLPAPGASTLVFVDVVLPSATLIIAGAGHIAQPLAKMAKMVDFEVIVVDDRLSFANRQRFPEADQVIVEEFDEAFARLSITANTYVVLVTRGHRHDETCLRRVAGSAAAYVGMIGSRRRIRSVFDELAEEGMPREALDRVYAPIGVDIGARTPEEIAVSIVAELIKVRRKGKASSLANGGRKHA